MAVHKFIVFTNPTEGKEQEFDEWYMNTHMPDVMKVPGFVSGQRFTWAHAQAREYAETWRYMTILDIETDDLQGTLNDLKSRAGTPQMHMSDSLADYRITYAFTPVTPVFEAGPDGGLVMRGES